MAPFESKGPEPQWKPIFDWALKHPPGSILDWAKLTELLGYDPSRPGTARSPIHTASKKLLEHHRMLVSVRGVGYRISEPEDHITEARAGQKSATRKIKDSRDIVVGTNRNLMTPDRARVADELTRVLALQYQMLDRHEVQIAEIEEREQVRDARWDVLERTLKQHGIELPDSKTVDGETIGPQDS